VSRVDSFMFSCPSEQWDFSLAAHKLKSLEATVYLLAVQCEAEAHCLVQTRNHHHEQLRRNAVVPEGTHVLPVGRNVGFMNRRLRQMIQDGCKKLFEHGELVDKGASDFHRVEPCGVIQVHHDAGVRSLMDLFKPIPHIRQCTPSAGDREQSRDYAIF